MSSKSDNTAEKPEQPKREYYPDAPKVTNYKTSGGELGNPKRISLMVEFFLPGYADPHTAEVQFRVTGGVAELRNIEDRLGLSGALIAADVASSTVGDHPAVDRVDGVDALLQEQRDWISQCRRYNGDGWTEMTEVPTSNVSYFVEGYEHETDGRYVIWRTPDDDSYPDLGVECHGPDGYTGHIEVESVKEARQLIVEETGSDIVGEDGSRE